MTIVNRKADFFYKTNRFESTRIANWNALLHAVKLLRHHGMSADSLRHVYKAVVVSELLYASPAWWPGFTSAADKQRLEASVRRNLPESEPF